ncbi:glycosyltransferase family 39 protein [Micromonospora sp. CPCC 205371]|nr:glycosyltransferase family 39 protein [Micromonospora sp. CPCC 205371]
MDVVTAPARRLSFVESRLPVLLLGVLFLLLGLYVVVAAGAYGRTWDEGLQNWYGEAVLNWYLSVGRDVGFIRDSDPRDFMPQHGPFAEVLIAAAQRLTGERWHTRSVMGGLLGLAGIAGIALCGRQLAGWWGAFLAALGLTLYPRYTGAMFTNSKDVPFTAAMIFVLWATVRLLRRRDNMWDAVSLGALLGAAMSIRATAILWYGVLAVALLVTRRLKEAAVVCGVSYATMLALWPYITLNPVTGLPESIAAMSRYQWFGEVLFDGAMVRGMDLPWQYAPQWLVVGSPPVTMALALVGLGLAAADVARRRGPGAGVLAGAPVLVPGVALTVSQGPLYNGLRHFLFAVPGMILLAVAATVRLWRRATVVAALAVALVAGHAEVAVAAARLHPFEYMYFSPVAGGYRGAHTRYESDYWRSCETPAARWLTLHYREYTSDTHPTIGGLLPHSREAEPPDAFTPDDVPRFWVSSFHPVPPGASYRPIHRVVVEGVVVCTVSVRD